MTQYSIVFKNMAIQQPTLYNSVNISLGKVKLNRVTSWFWLLSGLDSLGEVLLYDLTIRY
jgi:hypothetical protein